MAPPAGYVVTPSDKQPVRSANDTAEYRSNYTAKEYVNALYALDAGWQGQSVKVGIIDDGLNTGNAANAREFAGRVDTSGSRDFGYIINADGTTTKRNSLGDDHSTHGTPIAGIIGANQDGIGVEGLAPKVAMVLLRVDDWDTRTSSNDYIRTLDAISYAKTAGLKLLNMSLSSGPNAAPSSAEQQVVSAYASTGGLIVAAAGNSSQPNPDEAVNVTADNRKAWLFVVALNTDPTQYKLANYSNQAGSVMDRTVAAPGSNITTLVDGTTGGFSGTSSAAPVVTALAADILSKWPQLNGQQAGDIILNTAKDIGAPGVDAVFGHGLVDFRAALSPVNPTLSNGMTTQSVPLAQSVAVVPVAMSPAGLKAALGDITVLDQYGRDFHGSVSSLVIRPESRDGYWLRRRLADLQGNRSVELGLGQFSGSLGLISYQATSDGQVATAMTNARFGYASGKWGVATEINATRSVQSDVMGLAPFSDAVLAYAPVADDSVGATYRMGGGKLGLALSTGRQGVSSANAASLSYEGGGTLVRVSAIAERGTVMGYASAGALGLGRGADTVVAEIRQSVALGPFGWSLEGYGSIGSTRMLTSPDSLVVGSSALVATRLGLQATGPAMGGLFSVGVAQPLFVERGVAHLNVGTGYDLASQSLTYSGRDASLAGDQRRVQLTAGFASAGPRSRFAMGVAQGLGYADTRTTLSWAGHF